MTQVGRVLIYGGRGALGSTCVSHFKTNNFWIASIDLNENPEANVNILVNKDDSLEQQESKVLDSVNSVLDGSRLDAIICVAGGWTGGNASSNFAKNSDLMLRQSLWTSLLAASLAAHHLKEGGLLTLAGAKAALEPTPGMIGYGVAKAAVHQLTKSLAAKNSGMPVSSSVVAILPMTLDTPVNRKWRPNADFTTWTPLEFIAGKFLEWTLGHNRPMNGSLLQLITKDSKTEINPQNIEGIEFNEGSKAVLCH